MKIQLKRSNQLDGGSAKAPSIGYMEYGELAVNFNEADPCIFIKASDGAGTDSIVRIAGAGAESGGLPNGGTDERPDTPSVGDLFFDTDLNLIVYWDGNQWMPVSPGVITSDSKPTESLYAAGTLWYNSDEAEGALYILYEDPAGPGANAGGKVWVQIAGGGGGGGGSVIVADTAPNAADEGDLWFDSESGRLYIWYVNANSQGQWVDASPEGPDETQVGDLKYDIANEDLQYWDGNAWVSIGGIGSSVTTEEPTDPSNGDLWWNTADNTLYIWYEDGDTGQWVISVPQGSGGGDSRDSGEYVSKTETASQNIVSDLTLGTDKITFNATAGSAEFVGGNITLNADGDAIFGGGAVEIFKHGSNDNRNVKNNSIDPANNHTSFGTYDLVNSIYTNRLNHDGTAQFLSWDGNADTPGFNIHQDGLIWKSAAAQANAYALRIYSGPSFANDPTVSILNEGTINTTAGINCIQSIKIGASTRPSSSLRLQTEKCQYEWYMTDSNSFLGLYNRTDTSYRNAFLYDGTYVMGNNVAQASGRKIILNINGSAEFKGSVTAPNVTFNVEPDNDAYYTVTTDVDEEGNTVENRVYNGPTLDVKDRLQNLIARLDALEADEISDDAASNALLTLIASLTARVDARDAVIAELTTRIQTLEGGNN